MIVYSIYEKAYDKLYKENQEKDKEIEEYKKDYDRIYTENCKLRQEHNITDISLLDENYRLNNIIDELEKEFEWQLKKQIDIDKFAKEQGFLNYNPVRLMVEHFKNKLKELREGK